jgi:hypothetical protein
MSSGSPSSKKTPSAKYQKNGKMTRAVVANLNRQKSVSEGPSNGAINHTDNTSTSSPTTSPSKSNKSSPQKSLPPQPSTNRTQSKELPDVPEFYIVRPAPSTSSAKVERNDRRVFINRGTMEKMNVYQGSVVLIQRHDPSKWNQIPVLDLVPPEEDDSHYSTDDDEDNIEMTAVGVAWPMDRIEQNGIAHNC